MPGGFLGTDLLLRGLSGPWSARVLEAAHSPALPSLAGTTHPTCPQPGPQTAASAPSLELPGPQAQVGAPTGPRRRRGLGFFPGHTVLLLAGRGGQKKPHLESQQPAPGPGLSLGTGNSSGQKGKPKLPSKPGACV